MLLVHFNRMFSLASPFLSGATARSVSTPVQCGFKRLSQAQKMSKRVRFCASHPEKFRLTGRIRNIDLTRPGLTFPLSVPLKMRYAYIPQKHAPHTPTHDFINFKAMTGNEVLLNLENFEHLRPSELCSALIELSKREGSESNHTQKPLQSPFSNPPLLLDIDWNTHEWTKGTVDHIVKMLPTYTPSVVGYLVVAFDRLKITDEKLWASLVVSVEKTLHKFSTKAFAFAYRVFLENTSTCSEEFRQKFVQLLPVHLHAMTPTMMTSCFEITHTRGYLNEYLFEQHFHVLFWRRNVWFGADNLVKILNIYLKINFVVTIIITIATFIINSSFTLVLTFSIYLTLRTTASSSRKRSWRTSRN